MKKLKLNKKMIVDLSINEMNNLKGGTGPTAATICDDKCNTRVLACNIPESVNAAVTCAMSEKECTRNCGGTYTAPPYETENNYDCIGRE